jgi:hypothetical protein
MKALLLIIGLFISNATMAQSFNDTIYFNSGEERVVNVVKETNSAISYQYENTNGSVKSGRTRKSLLFGYAIYDEKQNLVSRHEKERKKRINEDRKADNDVNPGVGLAIVGGAIVVGLLVLVGAVVILVGAI